MYIFLRYCVLSIYFILFPRPFSTFIYIYIYHVPTIVSCYLVDVVIIDFPHHRWVIVFKSYVFTSVDYLLSIF